MKLIKIIIPCILLGGCFGTSQQATFYTQSAVASQVVSADYTAFVGVNRIILPKYMDRPQIATQLKDSVQINMSEYNRWVESPSILATRVLIEDLSIHLPAARIKINQFNNEDFDSVVSVEIVKLNAVLGEKAELVAWYTVKGHTSKKPAHYKFQSAVQIGTTYDDLVKGYEKLLEQLSQDIAGALIKK